MRVEDIIKKAREKRAAIENEISAMSPEAIKQADLQARETMEALVSDVKGMADEVLDDLAKGRLILVRDDLHILMRTVEGALEAFPRLQLLHEATGKGE